MQNPIEPTPPHVSVGDDLLRISTLQPTDYEDWLACWTPYTDGELTSEVTQKTWSRLVNRPVEEPVYGLILRTRGNALGFLHGVVYPSGTYGIKPLYIEDMYIDQRQRRSLATAARVDAGNQSVPNVFELVKLALEETIRQNELPVSAVRFDTSQKNALAQNAYHNAGFQGDKRVIYSFPLQNPYPKGE